jgi:hypothetical protein
MECGFLVPAQHPGASAVLKRLLLSDADVEVAAAAARVLAIRPDPTATRALETTLLRGEAHLRLAAAQALAHCGNEQSIPLLWNTDQRRFRRLLAHALIHAVHRLAGARDQPLGRLLRNSHPRVQQAALLLWRNHLVLVWRSRHRFCWRASILLLPNSDALRWTCSARDRNGPPGRRAGPPGTGRRSSSEHGSRTRPAA